MLQDTPLFDQIQAAVAYLRQRVNATPRVGLILGTGLSGLADELTDAEAIDYADIPHFPIATVESGWKGWLEDRRPNSAADPYKVAARIVKTVKNAG